jgi:segregation and condensation protein B
VAPQGRKPKPGKPVTWVTTPAFLDHFDLKGLDDLPRIEELTESGLFGGTGGEEEAAEESAEEDEPAEEERG